MIKDLKQLEEYSNKCTACMDAKLKGEDGKRHVVVCGDTGCLASHSGEIIEKFEK